MALIASLFGAVALACGAYALALRRRLVRLTYRLHELESRAQLTHEGARVISAAARNSARAVLEALDRTVRALAPQSDSMLVYIPEGDDLVCRYASGSRARHALGSRVTRNAKALPAQASMCRHHLRLRRGLEIMPNDRSALAVPLAAGDGVIAVAYVASTASDLGAEESALLRAVAHAAPAYALASERERDRARATFDGLTGLYTPRAFRDALREELGSTRLTTRTLALWFIDTDDFKAVNDSLGHAAGDRVLLALAELLRAHLIPDFDLPGRSGGDEFCAILRNAGKVSAIVRAQRFCDRVRMHDFGIGFSLSVSVGVAAFPYDASSANELLEIADAAMYHSKRTGRDRVSFHAGRGFRVNA